MSPADDTPRRAVVVPLHDDADLPWAQPATAPTAAPEPPPAAEADHQPEPPHEPEREPEPPQDPSGWPFTLLGHDHGTYYYLGHGTKQLTALRASQHTPLHMNMLADQSFWVRHWPRNKRAGFDVDQAASDLMTRQHRQGVYNPNRIRGRGAWWDEVRGEAVVHLGDRLLVGGQETTLHGHDTAYIYESAPALPTGRALQNSEAVKLTDLCMQVSWDDPISAKMLAGWIVCAQICGALRWKPNVQLLGPAQSGKSTVIDKIVAGALGENVLYCLGGTTEAALRAMLRADAMTVIIDDMDSSTARGRENNQAILNLMRVFSGDGKGGLHKASQSGGAPISYKVHSCYIYSGIVMEADKSQDISRIAVLKLKPRPFRHGQFEELLAIINATLTPEFSRGLFARCINLIPTIRANAEIFAQAIANRTGSRRSGDVNGHLFAGAYALHSTGLIDPAAAADYIGTRAEVQALIHEEKQVAKENDDGMKCLYHMLEQVLTDSQDGRMLRASVYETVQKARECSIDADKLLRRNGIIYKDGSLYVANDHTALRDLYARSPWPTGWGNVLKTIDGTAPSEIMSFCARKSRATKIPLALLDAKQPIPPPDDDEPPVREPDDE